MGGLFCSVDADSMIDANDANGDDGGVLDFFEFYFSFSQLRFENNRHTNTLTHTNTTIINDNCFSGKCYLQFKQSTTVKIENSCMFYVVDTHDL